MNRWLALGVVALLSPAACTEKPTAIDDYTPSGHYTATVQPIFDRSCTNRTGCHGRVETAGELDLTAWDRLIRGSRYGEVIIAFHPEGSHLIDHLTGVATPRMPLSRDPLPPGDIALIRDWIASGAQGDGGEVPFADSHSKIYVVNQGSDIVSVIDGDAMVVSRLIDVDMTTGIDAPHNIHVDRQGRYGYVTLINSGLLVQFDTAADSVVATAAAGRSPAHPITSPDGRIVYVTNWDPIQPCLRVLDTTAMAERGAIYFPPTLGGQPHGIAITESGNVLYTANTGGQSIFKVVIGATPEEMNLTYIPLGNPGERIDPLQVMLDSDESHVFVTCNASNDVRVVDTTSDEMVQVIPIGGRVASMGRSPDGSLIYVACWEQNAVAVIDTRAMRVVQTITNQGLEAPVFAHPHAAVFTPDGRHILVTNENTDGTYPQHHPSVGGGRNGNVAIIDAGTREIVKVLEVEAFPTGIASLSR